MKKQVENALNVTAKEVGKTEKEKLKTGIPKDISVKSADFDLACRQFYQVFKTIVLSVKYA